MSRDVHPRDRVVEHLGATLEQIVDQRVDSALVAGNKARREHDHIVAFDMDLRMVIGGELRQRRKRLTLTAAGEKNQLLALEEIGLRAIDKSTRRKIELPGFHAEPHALSHPPSERNDVASSLVGNLGKLANPMEMRRKRRQKEAPASA